MARDNLFGVHVESGAGTPDCQESPGLESLPTTKRQLHQFLSLTGYYRRFILQFATIVIPITDLLSKDSPRHLRWSNECKETFQSFKTRLCQQLVLYSPDFMQDFILQTDASERGLEAILSQEVHGEDHPILCISQKLFPIE